MRIAAPMRARNAKKMRLHLSPTSCVAGYERNSKMGDCWAKNNEKKYNPPTRRRITPSLYLSSANWFLLYDLLLAKIWR
jgi:hypothetical protein